MMMMIEKKTINNHLRHLITSKYIQRTDLKRTGNEIGRLSELKQEEIVCGRDLPAPCNLYLLYEIFRVRSLDKSTITVHRCQPSQDKCL